MLPCQHLVFAPNGSVFLFILFILHFIYSPKLWRISYRHYNGPVVVERLKWAVFKWSVRSKKDHKSRKMLQEHTHTHIQGQYSIRPLVIIICSGISIAWTGNWAAFRNSGSNCPTVHLSACYAVSPPDVSLPWDFHYQGCKWSCDEFHRKAGCRVLALPEKCVYACVWAKRQQFLLPTQTIYCCLLLWGFNFPAI